MRLEEAIEKQYSGKLRLRVCGICVQNNQLLLVQHRGLGAAGEFWAPPGGGMETGSTAEENLVREFKEETGLAVAVGQLLLVHEHLEEPLHAIEMFFEVKITGGSLQTGHDPESREDEQLIQNVQFLDWPAVKALGKEKLHAILVHSNSLKDLISMRGYYKFSR